MELTLYQVDAFAERSFEGNPAAVIPLESWIQDEMMQAIALENNLSETAFFVPDGKAYQIRWFTPLNEVDLCGHATLASAYVLFDELGYKGSQIEFQSRSGLLRVQKKDDWFQLDFPAQPARPCEIPDQILRSFGNALECLVSEDYLVVLPDEISVKKAVPNFLDLSSMDMRGIAITAPAERYDFVSRFFAPNEGINEDPVTGSSFTQLIPYWSKRLGKERMIAKQVSARGGIVLCEMAEDRVLISGKAVLYMQGIIHI
ncbi:MAG: PhzF family phenazine biosynthesis protein [Candidatus Marinimicrobia bacterium]|nr:PhzF family phenazine biosynthesis protein [Candidatus Neomarinimicrobiota bacterium]MCF7850716.1 PhzF family phenazine biosynthesis protein [Candidatus Neomarinimicrobiota bacterium]MCF7904917.1 PhzF family phenazine biosynthesis protein [Candidatus Neomarinimicrobiota bacterium]